MERFIRVLSRGGRNSRYLCVPIEVWKAWGCRKVELVFDGSMLVVLPVMED